MRVKEKINKLVVMVMIMLSFSMVIPNYSQAIDSKLGGPFQAFVCFFADAIENGLQMFFIGDKAAKGDGKKLQLNIKYSIATIVGNKIPMFNVNFFGKGQDGELTLKDEDIEIAIQLANLSKTKGHEYIEQYNNGTIDKNEFNEKMNALANSSNIEGNSYKMSFKDGMNSMITKYDLPAVWKNCNNDEEYNKSDVGLLLRHCDSEYVYSFIFSQAITYKLIKDGYTDTGSRMQFEQIYGNYDSEISFNLPDDEFIKVATEGDRFLKFYNEQYINDFYDYRSGPVKPNNAYSGGVIKADVWDNAFAKLIPVLEQIKNGNMEAKTSSVNILKPIVQKWYYAFRNLSLVALLSMLVYLGIKIILSSTAEDEAKYKKLLSSWFTAIVILFSLHYIMAFTLTIIDEANTAISANIVTEDGRDTLMEDIRKRAEDDTIEGVERMSYTILYMVLIIYILKFSWIYLKRVLHLTFLTIIAPLIAVTYPLDKEKDGTAQAFNYWTKEYFFNALLQLIHLILYYVLVLSAIELVKDNWVYPIIVIGFMSKAEKLIRKMFGMNNAGDASGLGSFTEGALVSQALSSVSNRASGGAESLKQGAGANGEDDSDSVDNSGIKMAKMDDVFGEEDTNSNIDNVDTGGLGGTLSPATQGSGTTGGQINVQNNTTGPTYGGLNLNSNTPTNASQKLKQQGVGGGNNVNVTNNMGPTNLNGVQGLGGLSGASNSTNLNYSGSQGVGNVPNILNNKDKNPKKSKKIKLPKAIKGVGNVLTTTGSKVFTGDNLKKGIRTVASLGLGSAGAVFGAATGIANGNMSDVFKDAALGAGAGSGIANTVVGIGEKVVGVGRGSINAGKNVKEAYLQGAYGEDYQEKVAIPKLKEKNEKDSKVKLKYKNAGFKDWKSAISSKGRDALYNAGIVDEDKIITALKIQEKYNLSDKELVQDTVVAEHISSYKDAQTMEKVLKSKLLQSGVSEENVDSEVNRRMQSIRAIAGL